MTFGNEFTNAVEQKQIAQQEAERAKFVVEKVWCFKYTIDILHSQFNKLGIGLIRLNKKNKQ